MPNTQQMAKLLNEAMDAGACGWSAQSLGQPGEPGTETQGGAAQNDFDGTPMPTDVMWPETRMAMAKVLGERGEGFIALSMGLAGPEEWEATGRRQRRTDVVAGTAAERR